MTPDLHYARCEREYRLAVDAKHKLERLAPALRLHQVPCATHNYGRLCAHVDGLAAHMIEKGLASAYDCAHVAHIAIGAVAGVLTDLVAMVDNRRAFAGGFVGGKKALFF